MIVSAAFGLEASLFKIPGASDGLKELCSLLTRHGPHIQETQFVHVGKTNVQA